jgi:methionyl-tRNA formyltransferase
MKIIFMGTSNFSTPTLEQLISSKHEIVGVFTKKPKEADRGKKLSFSPIYKIAEKNGLKIFTPPTFKNNKNTEMATELGADLIVVVSYGLILTKGVLESTKYGAINIHPSLLPRWRGSAPMERTLLSGDKESGVCIMKVGEGIDDGCVIRCEKLELTKEMDLEFLSDHLSKRGAEMLLSVIDDIEKTGKIVGMEQDDALATLAEKVTNEDAIINWKTDSVEKIHNKIRALGNSVGIFIHNGGNKIKILKADFELSKCEDTSKIGSVIDVKRFCIQCVDGILKPLVMQRGGGRAMEVKDFINGYRMEDNMVFSHYNLDCFIKK